MTIDTKAKIKRWSGRCFTLFLISGVFWSCNETKEVGPDTLGFEYYPLNIGEYRVYDVEEIRYLVTGFDTTNYQLRETIFDTIKSANRITYLLRRDIRPDAMSSWESDSVWSVARTENYLSITENNIPLIKLTFPVTLGRTWDGNSLNTNTTLTYYYQALTSALIDTVSLDDHIRVIIEDVEENVTGVDLRSEVYVNGVGLVEKDYLTQKKCTSSDCGAELGDVIGGRSLKQTLIEIGNEE